MASRDALSGERKQVTVLFADVVGSTELIRDLDPEDAQRLLDGVVQLMMDAVHRYEGTVSRLMGDGLMAMFGAPIAHEDHAVRACYAALALLEAARRHAEQVRRTHGMTVAVRVGISSGEVVVRTIRDDLHMDYTAMGQTVHLAARMEGIAEPGTAVLSAETLALVEGYVQVRALGPVPVKGLAGPVDVYQLLGAGQARTRLQVSAARGLTRFVGRDGEMTALYRALDRAAGGQGQLAALVGEPGVGKSRLVWEITHSHRTQDWLVLTSGSISYGKATSYLPIIDMLKAYCRIEAKDDVRAIREKVTGKLLTLDRALESCLPPLLALLDVPTADPGWEALDPAQRRRQTLESIKWLLLRESQAQPLLLVFEDLHWVDSETQALLDGLTESLPTARMLLLVNYRPEYTHRWGSKSFYTQLRIDPLGEASADELLAGLLGDHASVEPLKALLATRTDGNPLFLEESVRSLVETGALVGERGVYQLPLPVTSVRVPSTVQAVLGARIDRLPPAEKELLQTAAVIGKDVPDALLWAIADRTGDDLQRGLAHLQAAEFVYQARLFPEMEYTFKHALTHEVAYGSLLQERRKALHARVVEAIERMYPDRLDEHVEVLAHHATRAESWEQAAKYCQQAGARAINRSAFREAVAALDGARLALERLPQQTAIMERAIEVRLDLRAVLFTLGQLARVQVVLREAERLAEDLGDQRRLARILIAQSGYLSNAGDPLEAVRVAQRAALIGREIDDLGIQVTAAFYAAVGHNYLGDAQAALASRQWIITTLTGNLRFERFGQMAPPAVTSRAGIIDVLGDIGQFDEIAPVAEAALEIAEAANHPYSIVSVLGELGLTHTLRGDLPMAVRVLERALDICRTREVTVYLWHVSARLGYAYVLAGREDEGLPLLEQAALRAESAGHLVQHTPPLIWMGEAHLLAGRLDEALPPLNRALEIATQGRQRAREAYARRLLAEIASRRDALDGVEADSGFRDALRLADELEMRPLQAHCHLGLGKLYRQIGRLDEARAELQTAIAMLREMGMAYWLPEAEALLVSLGEREP